MLREKLRDVTSLKKQVFSTFPFLLEWKPVNFSLTGELLSHTGKVKGKVNGKLASRKLLLIQSTGWPTETQAD